MLRSQWTHQFNCSIILSYCFHLNNNSSLGSHVSKVRSIRMDSWSSEQLDNMKCGGNKQCVLFLKQHGLSKHHSIAERYDCAAAMFYQQILKARREGIPEPTDMPNYIPTRRKTIAKEGMGSVSNASHLMNSSLNGSIHFNSVHGLVSPHLTNLNTSFHEKTNQMDATTTNKDVIDNVMGLFRRFSTQLKGITKSPPSSDEQNSNETRIYEENETNRKSMMESTEELDLNKENKEQQTFDAISIVQDASFEDQ